MVCCVFLSYSVNIFCVNTWLCTRIWQCYVTCPEKMVVFLYLIRHTSIDMNTMKLQANPVCSIIGNTKASEYFTINPKTCLVSLKKSLADDPDLTTRYEVHTGFYFQISSLLKWLNCSFSLRLHFFLSIIFFQAFLKVNAWIHYVFSKIQILPSMTFHARSWLIRNL